MIEKYKKWLLERFGSIQTIRFGIWVPSRYAAELSVLLDVLLVSALVYLAVRIIQ